MQNAKNAMPAESKRIRNNFQGHGEIAELKDRLSLFSSYFQRLMSATENQKDEENPNQVSVSSDTIAGFGVDTRELLLILENPCEFRRRIRQSRKLSLVCSTKRV